MNTDSWINEVLRFGYEGDDFIDDEIGKERRAEAKARIKQEVVKARYDELKETSAVAFTGGENPIEVIEARLAEIKQGFDK